MDVPTDVVTDGCQPQGSRRPPLDGGPWRGPQVVGRQALSRQFQSQPDLVGVAGRVESDTRQHRPRLRILRIRTCNVFKVPVTKVAAVVLAVCSHTRNK